MARSFIVDRLVNVEEAYGRAVSDCVNPFHGYPCGQCANCLARRAKLWSARMLQQSTKSLFVLSFCLTYTDSMLSDGRIGAGVTYFDDEGNILDKPLYYSDDYNSANVLSKRDIQLFFKRLRKYNHGLKFKYFAKGEYGGRFHRPHAHCVLFVSPESRHDDTGALYTVEEVKAAILQAWFSAIEKYDYEDHPNMSRPNNAGKEVRVNPIVSFGEFNEDCAKYCAKYVSKASLRNCPAAQLVPEFILASKGMAVEDFKEGLDVCRRGLFCLCSDWDTMDPLQFKARFENVMKVPNPYTQDLLRVPNFCNTTLFGGYYEYEKKEHKDDLTVKHWRPKRGVEQEYIDLVDYETGEVIEMNKGEYLRNCYSDMVSYYNAICKAIMFSCDTIDIYLDYDDVNPVLMQKLLLKIEKDVIKNDNRVKGAKRYKAAEAFLEDFNR